MNLTSIDASMARREQANEQNAKKKIPVIELDGTANAGVVSFIPLRLPVNGLPAKTDKEDELWEYLNPVKFQQIWVPFPLYILQEDIYNIKGDFPENQLSLVKEVSEKLKRLLWYEYHIYSACNPSILKQYNDKDLTDQEKHLISGLRAYWTSSDRDASTLDPVQKAVLDYLFRIDGRKIMANYLSSNKKAIMMYGYILDNTTAKDFVDHKGSVVCILFNNKENKEKKEIFLAPWRANLDDVQSTIGSLDKNYLDNLYSDAVTGRKYSLRVRLEYTNNMPFYVVNVVNEAGKSKDIPAAAMDIYNETNWVADITRKPSFYDGKAFETALSKVNERLAYYEPNAASASQASPAAPDNSGLPFDTKNVAGQTEIVTHNAQGGMTTTIISAPQQPAAPPAKDDDLPF